MRKMDHNTFQDFLSLYTQAGRCFMTYNANIDAITEVDSTILQQATNQTITPELCSRITTSDELCSCIAYSMHYGEGAEVGATPGMMEWIQNTLSPDMRRMGGQIGIMANHLALLGSKPIVNIPFLSSQQKELFDRGICFVQGNAVVNWNAAETEQQVKENWIFEFDEGTEFDGVTAQRATRFVVSAHMEDFRLDAMPYTDFPFSAAIVSGFHSVEHTYADGTTAADVFAIGETLVQQLRAHGIEVHVELAYRYDMEIMQQLLKLASHGTSVGLDEQELILLLQAVGEDAIADRIHEESHAIEHILAGVQRLRQHIHTDRIHLHGRHYFLTVCQNTAGIAPRQIRQAMEGAGVIAAAYAQQEITQRNDLFVGLNTSFAEEGRAVVEQIADILEASQEERASGIFQDGDATLIVTPNRYVAEPRAVVGLGDVISASLFAAEVAFLNRNKA